MDCLFTCDLPVGHIAANVLTWGPINPYETAKVLQGVCNPKYKYGIIIYLYWLL